MGGWEAQSLHRDTAGREAQSWSESLAMYKHAHASRPFADEAYAKPARVTRYEMSRREAEYNPITQAWRDDGRERAARQRDANGTLRSQNAAKDRQLAFERSSHDVLNHAVRRAGLPDPQSEAGLTFPTKAREQRLAHPTDSMVQFNILSGLSVEEHHWAPPQHRPRVPPLKEDTKLRSITQQPREYNMLSNEYKRDHAARTADEHARARRVAAERFWATHDYDIMTSTFHAPEKEARYQALKQAAQAEQPLKQFNKLPPSYQKGEGYVYSLTNFTVRNRELFERFQHKEQRALHAKAHRWRREAEITTAASERAEFEQNRTQNRPSHNRYEEATSHGYDIVTSKGYHDKDPAPLAPARTAPKPTHMESLTTSSRSFWNERMMQTRERLAERGARPAVDGAPPGGAGSAADASVPARPAQVKPPPVPALDLAKAKQAAALEMTGNSSVRTGGFNN